MISDAPVGCSMHVSNEELLFLSGFLLGGMFYFFIFFFF
jgi:hypothetical protein